MTISPEFLSVSGASIVNAQGQVVRLRGFCLGGWMNMENFITGYPANESAMRAALASVLGPEKTRFFFERFLDYFITEDDLRFIKTLGCNVIRVPLNYRHFEADERPFEYKPEGFARLDLLLSWAKALGLYVILDLHAAPGCQNRGWHSDNPGREAFFWGQKVFEDRAVALWEALAAHYKGEAWIAGYNVMNEPDADDVAWLNHFYRRVTTAIRAVDPDHILFLEGNRYSQQFDRLDEPFDPNTVYSSHNYVEPGLNEIAYPGEFGGIYYDRARLEQEYRQRADFMLRHQRPNWVGEFGPIYNNRASDSTRLQVFSDMVEIIQSYGHHWTIWTYKDIGRMGIVMPHPASEWMVRTAPVRQAKSAFRCDSWVERHHSRVDDWIDQIAAYAESFTGPSTSDNPKLALKGLLHNTVQDLALSQALLPAYAEQFRGMSETEIDSLMQSFVFKNCVLRNDLVELLQAKLR